MATSLRVRVFASRIGLLAQEMGGLSAEEYEAALLVALSISIAEQPNPQEAVKVCAENLREMTALLTIRKDIQ